MVDFYLMYISRTVLSFMSGMSMMNYICSVKCPGLTLVYQGELGMIKGAKCKGCLAGAKHKVLACT